MGNASNSFTSYDLSNDEDGPSKSIKKNNKKKKDSKIRFTPSSWDVEDDKTNQQKTNPKPTQKEEEQKIEENKIKNDKENQSDIQTPNETQSGTSTTSNTTNTTTTSFTTNSIKQDQQITIKKKQINLRLDLAKDNLRGKKN